jgi:hypothetical protein
MWVGARGKVLAKPRDTGFSEPPRNRDLADPLVKKNADGHLEVFAPRDGAFCNRWQEAPDGDVWRHEGWNEKPKPPTHSGSSLARGSTQRRRPAQRAP